MMATNQSQALEIDFCGSITRLGPGESLEFGRGAELDIDDNNRFLHRRLGRLRSYEGVWMVANIGRAIPIEILDRDSRSTAVLASGTETPLGYRNAVLRFEAGPTIYEIDVIQPSMNLPDAPLSTPSDTITADDLALNLEQRMLIVALAEPSLRDPLATFSIPTNREAAHRLGWKITKYNRKLDHLCEHLADAGVRGLTAGSGVVASERRQRLVRYAMSSGLVAERDLVLLSAD